MPPKKPHPLQPPGGPKEGCRDTPGRQMPLWQGREVHPGSKPVSPAAKEIVRPVVDLAQFHARPPETLQVHRPESPGAPPGPRATGGGYVELHARSAFSFLEGASLPEEMVGFASELGYPAMALLDRDGVYGSARFHLAAKKAGLRAHIGAEVTAENGARYALLAESRKGYQNLCRLITRMKLRANKGEGAAAPDEIAEHAEGLICLSGLEHGPLHHALEEGGTERAKRAAEHLIQTFGKENVFVETARHFHRDEEARNQAAVEVARSLGLPLLATNAAGYAQAYERELLDVFTCIRNGTTLEAAGRLLARNSERHLKTPREMARLFADLPEAIANTAELSARLNFTLEDLGYEFPRYPVPDGETMLSFLTKRTEEGARNRYRPYSGRARKQIERELALIGKLNLAGYFLIVWDIVQFCRSQGILVQGRGSAANSAVCYSLGITAVDPVGMDLLFERFLSEERGEWPDIDLDLPSGDRRERVIQYVYERHGKLGAAMTANVITYRGRSAAREVGKVLGFDEGTLDRLSKLVRTFEWRDPKDTPTRQFEEAGLDLRDPRIRKFLELYVAAQDLPRHLGQHSGGMVICQGQLDAVVPLEPASMPGRVVVQWDKDDCADMGLIKVDLLGLGMMAVMEESIGIIRGAYGEEVDLAHLPPDDPAVYRALQSGDTIGMFQVESRAQQACLPRLRPMRFYDIVVQVGIIRPGPIVGKMMHPYLRRRQGRERPDCLHPVLEPVLRRTLGVPLFQEQLLRMSMLASGFSGGEAEELRRAFSHKRSEARMKEVEVKLRRGMEKNGITGAVQDQIVQSITSFALYGFPESHAASFALLAYASAWLKCHHLAAFTAAMLNNQPMGFYHPSTLVKDAQRHGLHFLPVDVARSEWRCTLEADRGGSGTNIGAGADIGRRWTQMNADEEPERNGEDDEAAVSATILVSSNLSNNNLFNNKIDNNIGNNNVLLSYEELGPADNIRSHLRSSAFISGQDPSAPRGQDPPAPHGQTSAAPRPEYAVRLGLCYVRGLRQESGAAIVRERERGPFRDINHLARRVPELRKDELRALAEAGALNFLEQREPGSRERFDPAAVVAGSPSSQVHRRDALWQAERAARPVGPLLAGLSESDAGSPLRRMSDYERLRADFRNTGLTIGRHPVAFCRADLDRRGVKRASDLGALPNGRPVRVAGCVIVRQRPGTAKGFVFLSLEDETGISNIILTPDVFEENRAVIINEPFLLIEGPLQNLDGTIAVRAERIEAITLMPDPDVSHDFR